MPNTPIYSIPYLGLDDAPDIAGVSQGIAEAVEGALHGNLALGGDLSIAGKLVVPGTLEVQGAAMQSKDSLATADQTISSTSGIRYQTTGFSFVAPPSGSGVLTVYADCQPSLNVMVTTVYAEIRSGGVVGSGSVIQTTDAEGSQWILQGNASVSLRLGSSVVAPIAGLTPGTTYNATLWAKVGAGSANMRSGRVSWEPR